jgi:hypothetical protein
VDSRYEFEEAEKGTPPVSRKAAVAASTEKDQKWSLELSLNHKKIKEPLLEPLVKIKSFDVGKAVPECLTGLTFVFSGIQ